MRHCLHFWQLRTWIHDHLCNLTIMSDTGQHSQFLRCFIIRSLCFCLFFLSHELFGRSSSKMRNKGALKIVRFGQNFGLNHPKCFIKMWTCFGSYIWKWTTLWSHEYDIIDQAMMFGLFTLPKKDDIFSWLGKTIWLEQRKWDVITSDSLTQKWHLVAC